MNTKPALSISAMDMLSKCGEQYRRRYIEKERIAPGVAAVVGRGVDASVNRNLTAKIETAELLTVDEVESTARDQVAHDWGTAEISLSTEERELGVPTVRAASIDKAVRLSGLHATDTAPTLNPTKVQRRWRIELPNYPMDLTGVTDIEELTTVRDTKTAAKSPRENEAELSDQLTLYALAMKVLDGTAPAKVALDYLVDTKVPKAVTRESTRDLDDFHVMLRRIETAENAIDRQIFVPARQSDWWCSARWCGYFQTCPYARHRKALVIGEPAE